MMNAYLLNALKNLSNGLYHRGDEHRGMMWRCNRRRKEDWGALEGNGNWTWNLN